MGLILTAFIYAAVWSVRFRYDHAGASQDFVLIVGIIAWISRNSVWTIAEQECRQIFEAYQDGTWYRNSILGLILFNLLLWTIFFPDIWNIFKGERSVQETAQEQDGQCEISNPLKPLVFPCRTTHTRFFPKKHSFSYSYLFVGIPIGWHGSISSFLSADVDSISWKNQAKRRGWLSVESVDYLTRGHDVHGLQGKLDSYLRSQVREYHD